MSIQLIFVEDMLVVIEEDREPSAPSSADPGESTPPAGSGHSFSGPGVVHHKPFGWGSGHERKDAPADG